MDIFYAGKMSDSLDLTIMLRTDRRGDFPKSRSEKCDSRNNGSERLARIFHCARCRACPHLVRGVKRVTIQDRKRSMKSQRILVIDDEPSITRTMKVNLEALRRLLRLDREPRRPCPGDGRDVSSPTSSSRCDDAGDRRRASGRANRVRPGFGRHQLSSSPRSFPEGNNHKRKDDCRALLPRQTSQPPPLTRCIEEFTEE